MYSRGHPSQNPRFSPQRRGGGFHPGHYNNNSGSPHGGMFQQGNHGQYRTPSPRGPHSYHSSPSPQFQIPASPMDSPFVRLQFQGQGNGQFSYRGPSPRSRGAYGQNNSRSPRHFSPRQNFSPYHTSPRGNRGNSANSKTSTPNHRHSHERGRRGSYSNHKREANPGGSSQIGNYYNATMMEDPWRNLKPIPFLHAPAATT